MIGVAVRRHHQGQAPRPRAAQERDHEALAGITQRGPGTPVDHDPVTIRRAQGSRISLADIEKKYSQTPTSVEVEGVEKGRREENRRGKGDPGSEEPRAARAIPEPP